MVEVRCPECGALYQLDGALAGQLVSCGECGATFQAPGGRSEVIDVHAEVVGSSEDPVGAAGGRGAVEPAEVPPGVDRGRIYTWNLEYGPRTGGPGCCTLGCVVFVVFLLLALQGLFSLF